MKKNLSKLMTALLVVGMLCSVSNASFAKAQTGKITGKTVAAGALSLIVWPGIGQAVNDEKGEKVLTHALLGLIAPYRIWSCYDALVDRKGGYWKGRI